jgi:hypothetical protein
MNITKETIIKLENLYSFYLSDDNANDLDNTPLLATRIVIGFEKLDGEYTGNYLGKTIKVPKNKETTIDYILNIINKDNVYQNFCNDFKKLLPEKYKNSVDVYPTSYGIGIFVALCFSKNERENIKKEIELILTKYNIDYKNEYSDAGWVFRYKISKAKENIDKINNII